MARDIPWRASSKLKAFFYGQAYLRQRRRWLVALAHSHCSDRRCTDACCTGVALSFATLRRRTWLRAALGYEQMGVTLATLFMGLPPVMLTLYTTATLGGYGETLLLGNLLILIAYAIESAEANRARYLRWGLFGLCAGFAFWTFGLILIYLVPVSLWLLYRGRWSAWRGYLIAFAGFAIGSLPWWASIGQSAARSWVSWLLGHREHRRRAHGSDSLGVRLVRFLRVRRDGVARSALPVVAGSRHANHRACRRRFTSRRSCTPCGAGRACCGNDRRCF
jgi:hypothetical protein